MKEWRSRGFVEDSEDEDELSLDTQNSLLKATGNATPDRDADVAPLTRSQRSSERTTAENAEGLRLGTGENDAVPVEEAAAVGAIDEAEESVLDQTATNSLRQKPSLQDTGDSAPVSSSLPELADLLQSRPPITIPSPTEITSPRILVSSPPLVVPVSESEEVGTKEAAEQASRAGWAAPQRNFRQRKPIQLNPYQILDGRYLQEMRSHGVRPTRVIHREMSPAARENEDRESDSQSVEEEDSQSVYNSPPRPLPRPRQLNDSSRELPEISPSGQDVLISSPPGVELDDDGLPTVETLLRHGHRKEKVYVGSKRRKLLHQAQAHRDGGARDDAAGREVERPHYTTEELPFIETPLSPESSPPIALNLPEPQFRPEFRFPPQAVSPQKPPTPATSSSAHGIRRIRKIPSGVNSSPAPHTLPASVPRKSVAIISDDSESSDDDGESSASASEKEEESGQLKVIRRRIKGVLPASWLKLDVKAQQNQAGRRIETPRERDGGANAQQPGVARKTFNRTKSDQSFHGFLALSSDEDSENERPRANRPPIELQQSTLTQDTRLSTIFPDDDPGDIMEDNAIDLMLPTASRSKHSGPVKGGKRQTRVTDAFGKPSKRPRLGGDHEKTARTKAAPAPRFKVPKLSILDVTTTSPDKLAELPSFLKIARRQAKRLPDQARERPGKKAIRLQTREDTQDVEAVLADWRSSKIKPRGSQRSKPPSKRKPLTPRHPNARQLTLPFDGDDQNKIRTVIPLDSKVTSNGASRQLSTTPIIRGHSTRRPQQAPRQDRRTLSNLQQGQLEAEEDAVLAVQDRLRFHQLVDQENQEYAAIRMAAVRPLPRTLTELEAQINRRSALPTIPSRSMEAHPAKEATAHSHRRQRRRKLKPQQVDVEIADYRQPERFELPERRRSPSVPFAKVDGHSQALRDLNPWGIPYAETFDILPLPIGTYFHSSTFVGSGVFKHCLSFHGRDLDEDLGAHTVFMAGKQYHWGPWSEDLASNVKAIFGQLMECLTTEKGAASNNEQVGLTATNIASSARMLEDMLDANSRWLSFSDPIDRVSFTQAYLDELEDAHAHLQSSTSSCSDLKHELLRLNIRLLSVTAQVLVLVKGHEPCSNGIHQGERLLKRQAANLCGYLVEWGLDEMRLFYDDNRRHVVREGGIKDDRASVEAFVVLNHCLRILSFPSLSASIWDLFNSQLLSTVHTTLQAGALEYRWLGLFSTLPLLEVSEDGLYQPGSRFQADDDNWEAVKCLMSRTFQLYQDSTSVSGTTINEYVCALLLRCHHLIQAWGWRKCDSIISLIFDFFAKREYRPLFKEDRTGSPAFLQTLGARPTLEASKDEGAYSVLLKIIATGLQCMRKSYPDKKMRSMVWRWLPNHSRTYDKDKEFRKEDLDALRNQHDLLSTLYWAAPASSRPQLRLIQNLVDHSASHLEACRISIKTWSNLVAFQLSTDEPSAAAEPFVSWLNDIFEQQAILHRTARPELEAQHEASKHSGVAVISADRLEAMIARNQSGTLAALNDVISGLASAFKTANSLTAAWTILQGCSIHTVLTLYDAKHKKTGSVIMEVLTLFGAFCDLLDRLGPINETQASSEESQDYGEWPDEENSAPAKSLSEEAFEFVLEQSAHLLSTLFGSEVPPNDELLPKMVEHWTRLACRMALRKYVTLDTFISDYGRHSWTQLRDTMQRRKYGPYFLSCLLKQNPTVIEQHRQYIIGVWMCSLVERDAQLKFQHNLTSDLLNVDADEPLLHNLPFTRSSTTQAYDLSLSELRERRLALLSSVLCNMRSSYQAAMRDSLESVRGLRADYSSLLKQVMAQMRANYEELGQGDAISGTYVTFVHSMIEFMQQYTADICTVDRFFTDSAVFPLPANDPTYLVGRLKSYDVKMEDAKMVKQLIIFVQNVSERAAVDGEQPYLVTQLASTISGSFDHETLFKTSMRSVLLRVIFPAYIDASMDESVGWIFARPLFRVCKRVFENLIYDFSATNTTAVDAVTSMLTLILTAMAKALSPLEVAPNHIRQPHVLSTLSAMLGAATECVPVADYLIRRTGRGRAAAEAIRYFADFSMYAARVFLDYPDAFPPTYIGDDPPMDATTASHKAFTAQQLQQDLRTKWRSEDGKYWIRRGPLWKEVDAPVGTFDEEKAIVVERIEKFHEALAWAKSL